MANKQRTTDDTMAEVKERELTPFEITAQRKWGRVKDLLNNRAVLVRWGDDRFWQKQLFSIQIGDEEAILSRQELEMLLRHV